MTITVYTKDHCPNCVSAKQLLTAKGLTYVAVEIGTPEGQRFLAQWPGVRQMPQIFIEGQRVGGLAGLQAALKQMGLS